MIRKEMSKEDVIELLKRAFPDMNCDAVYGALREKGYMESFPEDMVEERTSWDDLYGIVLKLESGFDALCDVVLRMAEDKVCEDGEDQGSFRPDLPGCE